MAKLDYTPLELAINQLEDGLQQATSEPRSELKRDGVIQRFEYSHELAMRFIKRVLETEFEENVDTMQHKTLLRTAFERGLIRDVDQWFVYRDARNRTSHTYDAVVAASVFSCASPFLDDARFLLERFHALHD